MPTSTDDLPKDRFVQTDQLLGQGGMALVWRAWHRKRGGWCAVKILRDTHRGDPRALQRFVDESRTLLGLQHRNVVAGWDIGADPKLPYLAMEIADGGTLRDWINRHGAMPSRMAVGVAIQMCKGLHAAHAQGVVHRDVKPHNVLVNRKGVCKISDFGIARIPREGGDDVPDATTSSTTGDAMGTMGYMAPEQRSNPRQVDIRTDVYGVGATLYDLLTGHPLHNLFMADQEPDMLTEIHPELRPLLIRAVKYRPEDRFTTMVELAHALHEIRAHLPEDPPDTAPLAGGLEPEPPPPSGLTATHSDDPLDDLENLTHIPRSTGSPGSRSPNRAPPSDARVSAPWRPSGPPPLPPSIASADPPPWPEGGAGRLGVAAPHPAGRPVRPPGSSGAPEPAPAPRSPRSPGPAVKSAAPSKPLPPVGPAPTRTPDSRGPARRRARHLESAGDLPALPPRDTSLFVVGALIGALLLLVADIFSVWSPEQSAVSAIDHFRKVVNVESTVIDNVQSVDLDSHALAGQQFRVTHAASRTQVMQEGRLYVAMLASLPPLPESESREAVEITRQVGVIIVAYQLAEEEVALWRARAGGFPGVIVVWLGLAPSAP